MDEPYNKEVLQIVGIDIDGAYTRMIFFLAHLTWRQS